MISDDLYSLFRSDMSDALAPYLWSDIEVWDYMNDAYRQFVRLTGGIADETSTLTQVAVVAGTALATVSPLILRFRNAYLVTAGNDLKIINPSTRPQLSSSDYGSYASAMRDNSQGKVQYMVTGVERGKVRWVRVPQVNDTAQLSVQRLPKDTVESGFEFTEVGEEHHLHFMLWMKHLAYSKHDAETFDRTKRDEYKAAFEAYCDRAKSEWNRYRSHSMSVAYGGL